MQSHKSRQESAHLAAAGRCEQTQAAVAGHCSIQPHQMEAEPLKLQPGTGPGSCWWRWTPHRATQRYKWLRCLPQTHLLTVSTLLPTGFRLSCSMTRFVRPVSTYSQKAYPCSQHCQPIRGRHGEPLGQGVT